MHKITLSFALSTLLTIIPIISMECESHLETLPNDLALNLIAGFEKKNVIRQLSKHFATFASRIKNENILVQPQLHLNQEALDRYLLYYGALGNTAIVRNLLARGANPNVCEDNGVKLIHHALQCGYRDILDMLLVHPDLVTTDIMSCKNLGLQNKEYDSIKQVLEHCAVDDADLLFYAIDNGLYSLMQNILTRNVLAIQSRHLYRAIEKGYINIMKFLITKGSERVCGTFLCLVIRDGYTSALQLLIDYGVDVNRGDLGYDTPLSFACQRGQVQMVKILIDHGVHVNEKNQNGDTVLHVAARNNNIEMVKMLLENGAHADEKNHYDCTPLMSHNHTNRRNKDIQNLLGAYRDKKRDEEKCVVQ